LESDRHAASALAEPLMAHGYNVLMAADGIMGLQLILVRNPDLVICEAWMPLGLGFSLAQRLRELGLGNIPFIFVTCRQDPSVQQTANKLHAAAFFVKPIDPAALLAAVKKTLAPHSSAPVSASKPSQASLIRLGCDDNSRRHKSVNPMHQEHP